MTAAINNSISATDYNEIRSVVLSVLGPSSGTYGYGQSLKSTAVAEGDKVTINEWTNLRYDLVNISVHQTGAAPVIEVVHEGDTVRVDPTTAPLNQYKTLANTYLSNRFNIAGGQYSLIPKGSASQVWPGSLGTYWMSYIYTTVTVKWTNAANARSFFNSGGQIKISSSRTGGTVSLQNSNWTSLLTSAGTQTFDGLPTSLFNFYNLTNSYTKIYSGYGTGSYTTNNYDISVRCNSVANNSTGTENQLVFLIEWYDSFHTISGVNNGPDKVDGTMSVSFSTIEPSGIMQPSGTFSVESPVITYSAITQVS